MFAPKRSNIVGNLVNKLLQSFLSTFFDILSKFSIKIMLLKKIRNFQKQPKFFLLKIAQKWAINLRSVGFLEKDLRKCLNKQ
jgi:hypothetical protein